MSFAYLPLYTGDYLRDTQHLSCSEHGIFLKLLMHCWDQKGPAPLDERKLCGIVNARSSDEIEAMRRVLTEFFTRMPDGHYNHRMQHEIERCEAISGARSTAGKLGYQAKAKQLPSKSKSLAKQVPLSPSPSPSPTSAPSPASVESAPKRASRKAPPDFALTPERMKWAQENVPSVKVHLEIAKFKDHTFKTAITDWDGAFRNWLRKAPEFGPYRPIPQSTEERDAESMRILGFKPPGEVIDA